MKNNAVEKQEAMAARLCGISRNPLNLLSLRGHNNQSLCGWNYNPWLPTRFGTSCRKRKQHGGESHRSRTGEERVRCYLALLFEPRHLGKEVLFCSAENNGAIVWKLPNFWSVLKITFDWTHWPVLSCLIPMSSRKRRAASSSTSLNWRAEENSLDINKKSRVWRYHHFLWVVQNTFKRPWNTLKTWTMLSGSLFFTSHCSDCTVKSTTVRVKSEWKPQPIP